MFYDPIKSLLTANKQLILTGAPGTGKTHLAREIAAEMIGCEPDDVANHPQFGFVQFHPNYDYTDFVEGLKPVKSGDGLVFERRDGVFMAFCKQAEKEPAKPFVFVIDEVNRADLSRVFGELFFAIEYRGKKGAVMTQYAALDDPEKVTKFHVPENVYIIGTMNDVDRSVESIDFALRRRFAWHEIKADEVGFNRIVGSLDDAEASQKTKEEAKKRYTALNEKIATTEGLGTAYQIGPAYFRKIANYQKDGEADWDAFWRHHLKPLLREYVRGMRDASTIIGTLQKAYNTSGNQ